MAVDYADLTRKKSELQAAADAAALVGARALAASPATTHSGKEQDALARASDFLRARAAGAQSKITPASAARTVNVALSFSKPLLFGGIIGTPAMTVSAESQAAYSDQPGGCIVALGQTGPAGIALVGAAGFAASNCAVWSNKSGPGAIATQGAAKITGREVCAAGEVAGVNSSPPAKSHCGTAPDPYAGRTLKCGRNQDMSCETFKASAGQCDKTDYSVPRSNTPVTLTPGVYCGGLVIEKADVVLQPGFYQIQDGPLVIKGSPHVSGANVSILLAGQGAVLDIQGSPSIDLSATSTGPMAGIAIGSVTPNAAPLTSVLLGSPSLTLKGTLYLPGQVLEMQGNPSLTLTGAADKALAYGFKLQGSPELVVKADDKAPQSVATANLRLVK